MNNIITNFNQILEFAKQNSTPVEKRRGILREYLQTKFIATLYSLPKSNKLSFVGGTSLRLLRNLNRFSEDLDFDNLGLNNKEIEELVLEVVRRFKAEDIKVDLKIQTKENKTYFDLRFLNILEDLGITSNPREKLMIKIDYADFWKGHRIETVLLNRYGFIETIVANTLNQSLVQKLAAYVQRNTTQPRDIYDIVWLYSKGALFDKEFAHANDLDNVYALAREKNNREGISEGLKTKLVPFLFNPDDIKKVGLFGTVLENIKQL